MLPSTTTRRSSRAKSSNVKQEQQHVTAAAEEPCTEEQEVPKANGRKKAGQTRGKGPRVSNGVTEPCQVEAQQGSGEGCEQQQQQQPEAVVAAAVDDAAAVAAAAAGPDAAAAAGRRTSKRKQQQQQAKAEAAEQGQGDGNGDEEEEASAAAGAQKAKKGRAAGGKAASFKGPTREKEGALRQKGFAHVGGADEAGRGPLAGPVVAAVCVVPADVQLPGLDDSKQLTEEEREALYEIITNDPRIKWAAHVNDHTTIDRINILQAALGAMREAANKLPPGCLDYLLVDGNRLPKDLPCPAQAVVKGDATCICIAAASVIAKVTRDRIMVEYHKQYPQYNFAQHKGYAVPAHYTAIHAHGPCDIHRRSFEPIKSITGWKREPEPGQEQAQGQKPAAKKAKKGRK